MGSTFSPIDRREMLGIAETMLKRIKVVCPRFSLPVDGEDQKILIGIWASALAEGVIYPRAVYEKAFSLFAAGAKRDDGPPQPGDMLRYCRLAVERMEADPEAARRLELWRSERLAVKDAQMG